MFKYHHILPSDLARQEPSLVFDMLASDDTEHIDNNYDSPYIRAVLG